MGGVSERGEHDANRTTYLATSVHLKIQNQLRAPMSRKIKHHFTTIQIPM